MRKCETVVENMFSIVFSGMQTNNEKYFQEHFQECNLTLENNFFSEKYFHLKIFYSKKIFSIEPNTALVLSSHISVINSWMLEVFVLCSYPRINNFFIGLISLLILSKDK